MAYVPWDGETVTPINLHEVPQVKTASEVILTIALFLGFKEIYMLGFDHDWFNARNVYFNQEENKKFFSQKRESKEEKFDSIHQMEAHAEMFRKYKVFYALRKNIYNANSDENSYVDTFPKIKYEVLFT